MDLVISGPNFGRNTSSAFSLSSGTIGAALSGSLAGKRSIAVSYGTFKGTKSRMYAKEANALAVKIIRRLWDDWGKDSHGLRNGEVDLYNVNLPMIPELTDPKGMDVVWTHVWRNSYGQLFKEVKEDKETATVSEAGPDAPPEAHPNAASQEPSTTSKELSFHFAPRIEGLVNPPLDSLPYGSDAWAIHHAKASVTPLRAAFAEASNDSLCLGTEQPEKESLLPGRPFKL